jgi:hypothetical protein
MTAKESEPACEPHSNANVSPTKGSGFVGEGAGCVRVGWVSACLGGSAWGKTGERERGVYRIRPLLRPVFG